MRPDTVLVENREYGDVAVLMAEIDTALRTAVRDLQYIEGRGVLGTTALRRDAACLHYAFTEVHRKWNNGEI